MKEEKDIIEGNKLIADFTKVYNCGFGNYYIPEFGRYTLKYGEYDYEEHFNEKELLYHKSFDWLMPVLQKIEKYAIIEINYALVVTCRICYLGKNKYDKAINFYGDNNGGREPIEAIWDCVVEFLKFYNEKEKNTGQNTKPDNEN